MNKFFVEEPKNMIINLIISFVVILATVAFAGLSGSDLVIQTAWYILIIHWVAFLPALIFKTEKFYDLTGSICYAFGICFCLLSDIWSNILVKLIYLYCSLNLDY